MGGGLRARLIASKLRLCCGPALLWSAQQPDTSASSSFCCRVGGDAAKARKVAQLQNDVSALEAALLAAQQEYERVKARNLEVRPS